MKRMILHASILILGNGSHLVAQEMVTDRPDFTESAVVAPSRMIQIESGFEYVKWQSIIEFSYPRSLIRAGLGHNLEMRLGLSGWTRLTLDGSSNVHLNDLLLEGKYQITQDNASIPLAVLMVSTIPAGDDAVSEKEAEIGLKLATAYDFSERLAFGVNLGAINRMVDQKRKLLSLVSLSLGFGITDRLGGFVEAYAEIPESEPWQPVMDGGLTFLLHPDAQLDLYVGKGLNDGAADLIIGGGFSFRFGY